MKELIAQFKNKLINYKLEGRSLRWFHYNYLKRIKYNYFIFQINGHKDIIDDDIIEAIKKYMEEIKEG